HGTTAPTAHGGRAQTPRGPAGSGHLAPDSVQTAEGPLGRELESQATRMRAATALVSAAKVAVCSRREIATRFGTVSSPPNGPALSCRPPVSVPRNARRTPGE